MHYKYMKCDIPLETRGSSSMDMWYIPLLDGAVSIIVFERLSSHSEWQFHLDASPIRYTSKELTLSY